MQFVEIDPQGHATNAGWAPHLDLEPIAPADLKLIEDVLAAPWIAKDLEQQALAHAGSFLVPEHFDEVRTRREKAVDKTLAAVHERLVKEINFWSDRYIKLQEDIAAGKDVRLTLENVRRTIDDLTARRESREKELLAMRHVVSATPGGARRRVGDSQGAIAAAQGSARLVGGCRCAQPHRAHRHAGGDERRTRAGP